MEDQSLVSAVETLPDDDQQLRMSIKEEPRDPEEISDSRNAYTADEVQVIENDADQAADPKARRSKSKSPSVTPKKRLNLDDSDKQNRSVDKGSEDEEAVKNGALLGKAGLLGDIGSPVVKDPKRAPNITMRTASISHQTKSSVLPKNIWLVVPVLVSLLGYFCFTSAFVTQPQAKQTSDRPANFSSLIKRLQSSYPGQKKHFWNNIIASYDTSIVEGRDPSIILLIHDETRAEKANAFLRDLVSGIDHLASKSNAYQIENSIFDLKSPDFAKWIKQDDSDQAKFLLDQKLESVYVPGRKIAMVKNLQDLPGKSALLFFTYGDDEHMCKFKGIILVLSVEVKSIEMKNYDQLVNNERELNSFAQKHLINLWNKKLDVDREIKPLLSRIGNIILLFN